VERKYDVEEHEEADEKGLGGHVKKEKAYEDGENAVEARVRRR